MSANNAPCPGKGRQFGGLFIAAPFHTMYYKPRLRTGLLIFSWRFSKTFGEWGYWRKQDDGWDRDPRYYEQGRKLR